MSKEVTDCVDFDHRLRRLEETLDLFELEIGGVRIWERMRTSVSINLLEQTGLTGEVYTDSQGISDRLRALSLPFRNIVSRNPFLADQSDILFFGHPRRKHIDDCWWDIYCDPIHKRTDFDYVHVEPEWNFRHYRPTPTTNLRYLDLITVTSHVLLKAGLAQYELSSSEKRAVTQLESQIQSEFGTSIDLTRQFSEELALRRVSKRLYDLLLTKVDPELVVIVAHSGRETFIEACHDANVPVAELQHGQICPYSYQHSYPGDRTKLAYPDYLLTFGEFWNDAADFPIADERIISVGYPYLEQQVTQYEATYTQEKIVFVSTPETGERLSEIAVQLANHETITHQIVYKLHPNEYDRWQTDYPWLIDAPLTVVDSNDPGLYELFAESSIQIGVGSTALYEGLAFELQTYLVDLPTVQWLSPIIENGEATLVDSAGELVSHIVNSTNEHVSYEKYFKPNAIENVSETLTRLLSDGTLANRH